MSRLRRLVFRKWSGRWASAIVIGVLLCCVALAFAPRAYHRLKPATIASPTSPIAPRTLQGKATVKPDRLHSRLTLQPEADRLRRRLGQRFLVFGREVATLVGTLKLGAQQYTALITRSQQDDGESVTIGLNGGPAALTWNDKDGAKAGSVVAAGDQRALLERLALDSPDQFILAQVRGASYYTVARQVRPSEAGSSSNYTGPTWDIVRIGEPSNSTQNKPQSTWRLYYLNTATGLIDKVLSQEQGETIIADISGWASQGGEQVPTHITWTRNKQAIMELSLNNIGHGPKQ